MMRFPRWVGVMCPDTNRTCAGHPLSFGRSCVLGRVRPPSWTSWSGYGALASDSMRLRSAENDIDETVLPGLTAEDLKELGVTSLGHRRKLLDAVAALRAGAEVKGPSADRAIAPSAPSVSPEDRAERRQVTVMFSDLPPVARMPEVHARGYLGLPEVRAVRAGLGLKIAAVNEKTEGPTPPCRRALVLRPDWW